VRSIVALAVLAACSERTPKRELDIDKIEVKGAIMRTDDVADHKSTFVLVDAKNGNAEAAWVTLAGELVDASGTVVANLMPQSLWIPAGDVRTYALVDGELLERPTAKTARVKVRGATVDFAPPAHIEELHEFDDHGQIVLQAFLVNDATVHGLVQVVAVFHDEHGRPLTRPFTVVKVHPAQDKPEVGDCPEASSTKIPLTSKCGLRFVGPPGAKHGTMFVAETQY